MQRLLRLSFGLLACAACEEDDYADCGHALRDESPSFDETLAQWAGPVGDDGRRGYCGQLEQGTCTDGKRFLHVSGLFVDEVYYFDARGTRIASAGVGDVITDDCDGSWFSPSLKAVRCEPASWETVCGEARGVLDLPYSNSKSP